ncbi:MAG: hypothetical protein CVU62_11780 [Deltaproteobacteria bacterium HGW-Deltaproteobacteria-2]|jgi:hypothetical protein|nr:MAG: hypothetical protein CVU62_11780 [Deltaproteobacteria bacterium HGW-Deltaproteobacteria-2]
MDILLRAENFISRKSDSNLIIAIFGIIYFASQIKIASIVHPLGIDMLRIQTTLSGDTFKEIASGWIASGQIGLYYKHFYFDNFHPIWYSIFLSLLIARAFKINNINPKFNVFILTPFVAGICDFFENMMHLYLLADLQRATPALVALSGLATNTKWFLALSGVAIVSILIGISIVKNFITKKK